MMDELMKLMVERLSEGKWEIGDQEAIVLNDSVIILTLENTGPSLEVIAGSPSYYDMDLNLTEENNQLNEYQKYEYCEERNCANLQPIINKNHCKSCGAYWFHDYLQKENYKILKFKKLEE